MTTFVVETKTKGPNETKDVGFDWDAYDLLTSRATTIASSSWTVPTGITAASSANTTTHTVVRLTGGTVGTDYTVTNRVTLASGEILERSLLVRVRTL